MFLGRDGGAEQAVAVLRPADHQPAERCVRQGDEAPGLDALTGTLSIFGTLLDPSSEPNPGSAPAADG